MALTLVVTEVVGKLPRGKAPQVDGMDLPRSAEGFGLGLTVLVNKVATHCIDSTCVYICMYVVRFFFGHVQCCYASVCDSMANDALVVVPVVVRPFIARLLSSGIVLYRIVLFSFISYWIISYEFDCAVLSSWFF